MLLTRFEQKNGHLAQVEVDEVFGFMCHITTEVPTHNAVPGGVVLLVKLLLDMGRNILFYVVLLQRLSSALHRVLLHLFRHVCIFDHRLPVAHGCGFGDVMKCVKIHYLLELITLSILNALFWDLY
ncbi:unknown_gene_7976 [Phodopus roborovskii]|uniref:Unknown_gene_7976 protein n=1 Tax=Phodopus roborovskii TaxID=109678 RepID=A0AAU9ZW13_PHORO|nr:unknown_gene_7976 [Phodopus roborovskii]